MHDGTIICWVLTLGLFGAVGVWVIRDGMQNERHKRRMLARRFCVRCGYDVHAGAGGRCPECGTDIPRGEDFVR
jgi:hypothetical protein